MTITDRNAPEAPAKAAIDPRTRTIIAVTALLACLLVGAGIVYWLLFGSSPKRRVVQVDPAEQASAARTPNLRMAPQRRDVPGIVKTADEWIVRGTTGEMRLGNKAAGPADAMYRFPDSMKLSPEQVSLLAGRFRILHDEAMAAEWKVTPQQTDRLRALQLGGSGMNPAPQQRDELWKLWKQYSSASGGQAKIDAQKKLIGKLDEVAKSLYEPARKQYTAKIDEIKKILTAEQVETITKR